MTSSEVVRVGYLKSGPFEDTTGSDVGADRSLQGLRARARMQGSGVLRALAQEPAQDQVPQLRDAEMQVEKGNTTGERNKIIKSFSEKAIRKGGPSQKPDGWAALSRQKLEKVAGNGWLDHLGRFRQSATRVSPRAVPAGWSAPMLPQPRQKGETKLWLSRITQHDPASCFISHSAVSFHSSNSLASVFSAVPQCKKTTLTKT